METHSFDRLTKGVAGRLTRGAALRQLGAGGLAASAVAAVSPGRVLLTG